MIIRWATEPLAAVCQLVNRGISPVYVEKSGVAVLNQKCVRGHTLDFGLGRRHDAVAKKVPPDRFLRAGDVLVNSTGTGTLGRVAQLRSKPTEPTTVDSHVTIVRPIEGKFYPDFFGYALIAIEHQIQQGGEGCGGQTELSRSKLSNDYFVSYPKDLDEQRRIVAILDEAFKGIDAAVANAEKNLANARELFESYLNFTLNFDNGNIPARELATLCDQSRVITYGVIKLGEETPGGVPCLRTSNVRWLKFETDDVKRIAPSLSNDYKRTILKGGEVLVNVRGTLGGVAAVDSTMVGWNVSREVAVVPSDENKINQFYLAYWIARKASQGWLTDVQKGVAYTGINIADLRQLPVAVPDRKTQVHLVDQLHDFSQTSRRLESVYQQKLLELEDLKQSLLQKAFAGQLTADSSEAAQPKAAE